MILLRDGMNHLYFQQDTFIIQLFPQISTLIFIFMQIKYSPADDFCIRRAHIVEYQASRRFLNISPVAQISFRQGSINSSSKALITLKVSKLRLPL